MQTWVFAPSRQRETYRPACGCPFAHSAVGYCPWTIRERYFCTRNQSADGFHYACSGLFLCIADTFDNNEQKNSKAASFSYFFGKQDCLRRSCNTGGQCRK